MAVVLIRDVMPQDWPAIWAFMRPIVAAGETYVWDRQTTEEQARAMWLRAAPARAVVAVDPDGTILGTAEIHPNYGGPGAHIANAGFMVDPDHGGRGVGRALGQHVVTRARADGYQAMVFNAVVETNLHAVKLWRSLGFEVLATIPGAFRHPSLGYVGLHVMHRRLVD